MLKKKFRYNPETLTFQPDSPVLRVRLIRSLPVLGIALVFVLTTLHLFQNKFKSPTVLKFEKQKAEYSLKFRYLSDKIQSASAVLEHIQYNDDHIYRTYFEVPPLPASQRDAGFGGNAGSPGFYGTEFISLLRELDEELNSLSKKLNIQSKSYKEIMELIKVKEKRLAARPAIQPLSIKDLTRFGSAFGMRMHPILQVNKMHEGIDLTAPRGTPVYATADGTIGFASFTTGGYGNKIIIDHGYGYQTLYGHLFKMNVAPGDKVKRGDVIGTVGSTGLSTTPHLHYEVIVNNRKVNPIHYYANDLSADEFDKMIRLLSEADPSFDIN